MRGAKATGFRHVAGAVLTNLIILAAGAFTVGALYTAMTAGSKHYAATAGQKMFAEQWCVDEQHGSVGSIYVTKPDLFNSNGSTPKLTVRCTFGKKEFMLKVVDLERLGETPRAGS